MSATYPHEAVERAVRRILRWGRDRYVAIDATDLEPEDAAQLTVMWNRIGATLDYTPYDMYTVFQHPDGADILETLRLLGARIVDYDALVRSYL